MTQADIDFDQRDENEPSMEEILSSIRRIIADESGEDLEQTAERIGAEAEDDVLQLTDFVSEDETLETNELDRLAPAEDQAEDEPEDALELRDMEPDEHEEPRRRTSPSCPGGARKPRPPPSKT